MSKNADTISADPIVRAAGLRRSFAMGDHVLTILKDVDLAVRPGEFLAIEGRSGSGKSTLLHILGALDTADSGSLKFEGQEYARHVDASAPGWARSLGSLVMFVLVLVTLIVFVISWIGFRVSDPDPVLLKLFNADLLTGLDLEEVKDGIKWAARYSIVWWVSLVTLLVLGIPYLVAATVRLTDYLVRDRASARVRNRDFGFVFQFYHLLPELNVLENTMLGSMIQYSWTGFFKRRGALRDRAIDVLTQLGMGHRLRHRPGQLSGGERQRVAIARALMNSPRVLFADEPTGNLDAETGLQIMGVLEKLHQEQGQTIVMVTHDRTLARRADRVLVMKDGKLERAET